MNYLSIILFFLGSFFIVIFLTNIVSLLVRCAGELYLNKKSSFCIDWIQIFIASIGATLVFCAFKV